MGKLIGWLLTGGATAVLDVASKGITSIGQPLSEAYAAKQKALTDQHNVDAQTAKEITLKGYDTDLRVNELAAAQTQIDSQNKYGAWMRQVGFAIAAYVVACAALQYTFPKLAAHIGLDVSKMPDMWAYVFIAVFLIIFGIRQLDKSKNANTVMKMQATIANTRK